MLRVLIRVLVVDVGKKEVGEIVDTSSPRRCISKVRRSVGKGGTDESKRVVTRQSRMRRLDYKIQDQCS